MRKANVLFVATVATACICIGLGSIVFADSKPTTTERHFQKNVAPTTGAVQHRSGTQIGTRMPVGDTKKAAELAPPAVQDPGSLTSAEEPISPPKPEGPPQQGDPWGGGGPRQGGDTCATATVIPSLPYTDAGTTSGYANNYDSGVVTGCPYTGSTAPDVVYMYTPTSNVVVTIDLCWGTTDYDTKVYVWATTCSGAPVACSDDACSAPLYPSYVSKITGLSLTASTTYYIVVDGYGASNGPYSISVAGACSLTCPPGGVIDDEPDCYDNYTDTHNGGCNWTPNVFEAITPGTTFCGECGTYLFGTSSYGDMDWFQYTTVGWEQLTWTISTEFDGRGWLLHGVCGGLVTDATWTSSNCIPASGTYCYSPGTLVTLIVAPNVFSGIPCAGDTTNYVATLTSTSCAPTYCTAGSSYGSCDEYISRVQIGTIDNASVCDDPSGYYDYTYLSTNVAAGGTYPITITNGNPYSGDYGYVWVDWNNDFDFADANEYFTTLPAPGTGPYIGDVVVPVTASAGAHRMRVRISYNITPGNPCGVETYGEVEDYTLNVTVPEYGACCRSASGNCENGVADWQCLPPDRFMADTDCLPDPFDPDCGLAVCCLTDGTCLILSSMDCLIQGGTYRADLYSCAPINPCKGACCPRDPLGTCTEVVEADCIEANGFEYMGDGTICADCPQFVNCPLATPENEPCDDGITPDATNGGCNSTPPVFQPITCGQTYFGTGWFNGSYRDTDWFSITTTQPAAFIWTVEAEFDPILIVMDAGSGNCTDYSTIGYTYGLAFEPVSLSMICLPAGQYYFFVAVDFYGPGGLVSCYDHQNAYCANLTCIQPCEIWCPCPGDMQPDDSRDGTDVQGFVDCLLDPANGPGIVASYGCKCADAQNDGDVDTDDIPGFVQLLLDDSGYCYQLPNDNCANATDVTGPYPQTLLNQSTIGAEPDCPLVLDWNGVWYKITLPYALNKVTVEYCPTATDLNNAGIVMVPDCTCEPLIYASSYVFPKTDCASGYDGLEAVYMVPGGSGFVYLPAWLVDINGDGLVFDLTVNVEDCSVTCQPGDVLEGEPTCYPDYVDATNGGCNSTPNVFSPIACNTTVCGTSGVYTYLGSTYRDTDWYAITIPGPDRPQFTFSVQAEFPVLIFAMNGGTGNCTDYSILMSASGAACTTVSLTTDCLQPGLYWFWVGPSSWDPAITCGLKYRATLTCVLPCSDPTGACCVGGVCAYTNTQVECQGLGGLWFEGYSCPGYTFPDCGALTYTQNTDTTTITAGNSVACAGGGQTTDNWYCRSFSYLELGSLDVIKCVEFAVESYQGAIDHDITINVYWDTDSNPAGGLTLLGTTTVTIPATTSLEHFTAYLPAPAVIPAGMHAVTEIFTPSTQVTAQPGIWMGSNAAGQSSVCYIMAPDCGLGAYASLSSIGFPNMHLIEVLRGD